MAINFYCPVCGAPIRGVPDEAACQRGTCLKCGSRIPVPSARRVNDDDIVAILGPVDKHVQSPSALAETLSDPQPDQSEQQPAGQDAVEISVARNTQEMGRSSGDLPIIARIAEFLRSMVSRLQRFNPRSIRRRKQLRSVLRPDEKFIVESDQLVLTNQRLMSLISHEELDLKIIESAFAFDVKTASDLILHTNCERRVFCAIERQFVHRAVEAIRTMLLIEPGTPNLPRTARETSDLFDAAFGLPPSKVRRSFSVSGSVRGGFKAAASNEATDTGPTADQLVSRHRNSGDSAERARRSAMAKLHGRGYRLESQLESARVVRAMRNCDISCLSQLADEPGNKPLRRAALAALRDLGSQAAAALPALRRLLDSDELRSTRFDATQDDLLLLTMVSETYLAVSSDGK